jgi:prevent-host-death family protein
VPRRVSIAEARDHLTRLLRGVERGESIELTRRNTPVAAIVPMSDYARLRRDRKSFWTAVTVFRAGMKPAELADLEEALEGLRDRSPGREVDL